MPYSGIPSPPSRDPMAQGIIDKWSSVVDATTLHGSWRKRAFWLLEMADRHGADSEAFRALCTWDVDPIIIRILSEARDDSDRNT